jgi:TonB family protein
MAQISPAPIIGYLDSTGQLMKDKSHAQYYRTVEQNSKGFVVRDYFISSKLAQYALCAEVGSELFREGKTIRYHENGSVQEEGDFEDNRRKGVHTWYFENGHPKIKKRYDDDYIIYIQAWTEHGVPQLINGAGVIQDSTDKQAEKYFIKIADSVSVSTFSIDSETSDTIYTVVETFPEYIGGDEQLIEDLMENLTYPKEARKAKASGTVYVQFKIDKLGDMKNLAVVKSVHPQCDAAALQAVSMLSRWKPGSQNGKPVQVNYVIPIKFNPRVRL